MVEVKPIEIQSIGSQGDGIGTAADGTRVFIPGALPGETWQVEGDTYTNTGPMAQTHRAPICPHFDVCGGCVAQHMSDDLYRDWKRSLIIDALAREEIETDIHPIWFVPPESRRRAMLELKHDGTVCVIGFHKRKGHDVFDMATCPVLAARIVAALPALRDIGLEILDPGSGARVSITQADNGIAISIETKRLKKLAPATHGKLAQHAKAIDAIQLLINGEIFVAREAPTLQFDPASVVMPERAFLQAVPEAETEMQRLVCDALEKSKSVVDIFCGVGTFTIPLAQKSRVTGYDNDVAAIDALNAAVRHTQGIKPVTANRRDLFRQPLGIMELKGIDGIVINPPRAGAKAQCEQLAKSKVRTIVMVSCNPSSFARDAKILIDGGYSIGAVTPIDQFLWSPHLEVVATFTRR